MDNLSKDSYVAVPLFTYADTPSQLLGSWEINPDCLMQFSNEDGEVIGSFGCNEKGMLTFSGNADESALLIIGLLQQYGIKLEKKT